MTHGAATVHNTRGLQVLLDGESAAPIPVGHLWLTSGRAATFAYDPAWLTHPHRFALEPALPLTDGRFHTESGHPLFRCFTDALPQRWGSSLFTQAENAAASRENRAPRTLTEADLLLATETAGQIERQGALLFVEKVLQDAFSFGESGSTRPVQSVTGGLLGGARPKTSVWCEGRLFLAKLPAPGDLWDVPLCEYLVLRLAGQAGIRVPAVRLEKRDGHNVLLTERFDRRRRHRLPFISALALTGASDGTPSDYGVIADAIRAYGAQPDADLPELWTRLVFNSAIANTDDHLRNHGLVREAGGWRLSPVYDLEISPGTTHPTDLESALSVADYFGLTPAQAEATLHRVLCALQKWECLARQLGAASKDMDALRVALHRCKML